jgi:hypothetical protein
MNIFEQASRMKLRFPSSVGDLTTENLWELQLTARGSQPDLDKVARAVHSQLRTLQEGSFVNLNPDPRVAELELKLEIAKHVIASKLADAEAAQKALELTDRKRRLLAALASKQDAELLSMSREEIEAEIAKLEAA